MKSRTTYINKTTQSGFTMIEMLIVISIILIVGGTGLFFGFDTLRGYSFHSDRDVLVSALQHARSEAMANICRGDGGTTCIDGGLPHGVFIDIPNKKYILFQGTSYATANHAYDATLDTNTLTKFKGVTEVVFAQLSGNASTTLASADCPTALTTSTPICIIIGDNIAHGSEIDINTQGQIQWTN